MQKKPSEFTPTNKQLPVECCTAYIRRLHNTYAFIATERVEIIERSGKGAGTIEFRINRPALSLRPNSNFTPVTWVVETQCADGAIIVFDDHFVHLHIVELKSKVAQDDLITARKQFYGMYLNALALRGVVNLPAFDTVTCHIAYTKDKLSAKEAVDTIFLKPAVGGRKTFGGIEDWSSNRIEIGKELVVELRKIQRDGDGNGVSELFYN